MKAIDFHAHVPRHPSLPEYSIESGLRKFFRMKEPPPGPDAMAAHYRSLDVTAVIFSVDAETEAGDRADPNDYVAEMARQHPDVFIGFCTVDPHKGAKAVRELERSVRELGLKGLKLHPIHQGFCPDAKESAPLFKKCQELGVPVILHSGYAAAGAGSPGGGGFRLSYSRPIPHIDNLAAEFPDLTIIMAHPGWPWVEEQIAVALHKANVYIDLSGWAPKYIPERLVQEANARLRDKVLFGSDYPYLRPERWLDEFAQLAIKDDVRPKVLLENAKRVLKMG